MAGLARLYSIGQFVKNIFYKINKAIYFNGYHFLVEY